MPPLSDLIGPFALTVAAVAAVVVLWREHLKADADDRAMRDAAINGWKAQTDATNRLADAIESKLRDDADRHRRADR